MVGDSIANLINGLKNASTAGHSTFTVRHTKINEAIAKILKDKRFVEGVDVKNKKSFKELEITLAYEGKTPKLQGAKRVSKFSRRVYLKADEMKPVKQGYGLLIVSTPQGVMTGSQARKAKVGGEAICQIW